MSDDRQTDAQGSKKPQTANLRPKTIYLLLERYAFFHSPSQVGDVDQRFMGRDRIIQKLKTLLTNAESSSGAYLVTGYRGMGKSSFVGKVLHDINSYRSSFKRASRYFRILLALMLLAQIEPETAPWIAKWLPLLLGFFLLSRLWLSSPVNKRIHRTDRKGRAQANPQTAADKQIANRYGAIAAAAELVRIEVPVSSKRPRAYMQDAFLVLLLHGVSLGVIWAAEQWRGDLRTGQHTTIYLLFFVVLYLWNLGTRYGGTTAQTGLGGPMKGSVPSVWRVIRIRVRDWVAHVDQVHIRINLGYDRLSELDVLRLLARNMATAYRAKMRVLSFPQVSWTFVRLAVLYFVVGLGYYMAPLHVAHQRVERRVAAIVEASLSTWIHPRAGIAVSAMAADIDAVVQRTFDQLKRATPLLNDGVNQWAGRLLREPFGTALKIDGLEPRFRPVPADVDYIFWLYLCLAWFGTGRLAARGTFGVVSHGQILRRLERLNDSIEANVSRESGAAEGQVGWVSLRLGQSRREYPRLSEREIEKEVIEILDDVARIPRISLRPEFIVIFDEVDKIEPRERPALGADDDGAGTRDAVDGLRSRQETVLRLLSNLKYLLTTAKAKFIFIAGRELFDAALADVSDRNFFMGSIFNEVINVDSFLKDRTHSSGAESLEMSGMTEQFVFSALLPQTRANPGAESYRTWMQGYSECATAEEQEVVHEVLDNFVTYLTYRSNGAPKKLSALFERHVVEPTTEDLEHPEHIVIGASADRLYLRFDWKDQYTFSVAAYVMNPLFAALDRAVQEFGDKLLVSAAFLVDHLYKFHRSAFSWRNIELTPEILDINRAPHLRQLIGDIVTHLKRGHLKEIDNGLHNLKFRRRISEEISVLSKLNEREAAAFNFTLDESLAIKRHYTQQLRQLQRRYVPHFSTNPTPEWIRSISFLHMIVGDLHFYDEEYDNAIVEYMEAVQLFGDDRLKRLPFESFIVFVRNSLKLGFAHEKRRTLDSAYVVYGKLASRIIRFREITEYDTNGALCEPEADAVAQWIGTAPYNEKRAYVAFREEVAGHLRLLYQPTLAKLHAKEKLHSGGLSKEDVKTAEREFRAIVRQTDPLVEADFASRIGNVLFFKNRSWVDNGTSESEVYCLEKAAKCTANSSVRRLHQLGRDTPCAACREYNKAIDLVCDSGLLGERPGQTPDDRVRMLLRRLSRTADLGSGVKSIAAMKVLAGNLASAADAFLSCCDGSAGLGADWLSLLKGLLSEDRVDTWVAFCDKRIGASNEPTSLNKLEEVAMYLFLAAGYFRRSGDYRGAGWQYTKLLYVLRDWLRRQVKEDKSLLGEAERLVLKELVEAVARRARQSYDAGSEYAYVTRTVSSGAKSDETGERHPTNWDVTEVETLCEELGLLGVSTDGEQKTPNAEQRIGSLHNRILELRLQAIRASRTPTEPGADLDAHWQKVAETWREMIRVAGFFGPSYYVSHSLVGTAHYRAAEALGKVKGEGQVVGGKLVNEVLSFHRRAAVRHYRMALDTHAGGDAYREFIDRMVYLNDDFTDDLYHFCAAQERFWLNRTGVAGPVVYERLDQLRKDLAPKERSRDRGETEQPETGPS